MKAGKAARIILAVYLCVYLPVLSWWAPHGYNGLGNDKFLIYRLISLPFAVILLPLCIRILAGIKDRVLTFPDAALLIYTVLIALSFVFSVNKAEALWGTVGWRMGFITSLLALFFYFAARVIYLPAELVFSAVFASSVPVLVFGVLNRFGIYPLWYMGVDESFISTLGNINWYGGYLCAVSAVALGFFVNSQKKYLRILSGVLFFLCSLSVVTQGADGTTLAFFAGAAAAIAGAAAAGLNSERGEIARGVRMAYAAVIFALCLEALGIISRFYGESLTYAYDNTLLEPARNHVGIVIAIAAAVIAALLKRHRPGRAVLRIIFVLAALALCIGAVFLLLLISGAAGNGIAKGFIKTLGIELNDSFGNGRGGVWRVSGEYLKNLPGLRKLFGVGPDSFAVYGYTDERVSRSLLSAFGAARLTNAHSELFTAAINTGIPSALALAAFYIFSFIRLMKHIAAKKGNTALNLSALACLVSLTALQSLSFPTVCAWPLMLIILGEAEKFAYPVKLC